MFFFIVRRLLVSIPLLLVSSFFMFWLVTISGDPLAEYRQSTDPNREQTMAKMRELLQLDKPFGERYVDWLFGVFRGDFGLNRSGQDVSTLLSQAAGTTFRLVIIATVLAILLGIFVGVITAVRQYSVIDYSSTFAAFLFFSLPLFWLAVLLKEFGAIKFNNYLEQPGLSTNGIIALTVLTALMAGGVVGGTWFRRLGTAAAAGGLAFLALWVIDRTEWIADPGLSLLAIVIFALVGALIAAALFAPLDTRRVLVSAVIAALAGVIGAQLFDGWIAEMTWRRMFVLLLLSLVTGAVVGAAIGGEIDRRPAIQAGVTAAFFVGVIVVFDQLLSAWEPGRTIATIGSKTPNLEAPFWETQIDNFGHQVLPSLALTLVGFAGYMRFTRSSMLETLSSDYVRTAKAKGLPALQVILRHAFRTAMIPVMTVAALAFGAVIDGAVITERVFAWKGMGTLFIEGLNQVDPYPVMGFLVITSVVLVLFNALADILYAYLDPRIRP